MSHGLAAPPVLPPDLDFELMNETEQALLFSFEAKKDALGPHIAVRWGWDEGFQLNVHRQRFRERPFSVILRYGQPAGTLSWLVEADHIRFGEFYLLGEYRSAGTGTRILRHAIGEADRLGLPLRLEYLKWNPVAALYRRHGFLDDHETETHFHLQRPVSVK